MSYSLVVVLQRYGGPALVVAGLAWSILASASTTNGLNRQYQRYRDYLNQRLSLLFLPSLGQRIIGIQAPAVLALVSLGLVVQSAMGFGLAVLAALAPAAYLHRARQSHVRKLEDQVEMLITSLANALKTVPSPAAAMAQVVPIVAVPMRLELERILKEMRLGSTLEQSLLAMSSRLKSPALDSALSALVIGLQVGGNLPNVLETTAGTIREMNRLEGVVRTKTAESRVQLWVLAILPFALCFAFTKVDGDYFTPIRTSVVGNLIVAVAGVFWLMSLLLAHRILKVDI